MPARVGGNVAFITGAVRGMLTLNVPMAAIAIPFAAQELHISLAVSVWILTSYTVVFGGMLLLGGRIADYLGRKRSSSSV